MKRVKFAGGRIVKTGLAVFLTAWICELLNWPPVFAVITAIVTIEPTVSDSIKKGIIRFPASAIGSAYAVFFISLFGNSPLTYTLAAVFTIATCYKLNLHAGLLVATLTSVAMVEVIHSNFFIAFFIRLGTTTVGLFVSTAVNMFVLPPDYTNKIIQQTKRISHKTGILIEKVFHDLLENRHEHTIVDKKMIRKLGKKLLYTESLIRFQQDETKYHPLIGAEKHLFQNAKQQIANLRLILYHLENLMNTPITTISWTIEERQLIVQATSNLAKSLKSADNYDANFHQKQLQQLTTIFWEDNEEITKNSERHPTYFPPELIVLYELLSIYNLVANFYQQKKAERN